MVGKVKKVCNYKKQCTLFPLMLTTTIQQGKVNTPRTGARCFGKFPISFGKYSKVREFGKFPLFVRKYSEAFGFGKLPRSRGKYSEARGFGEFRRSLSNYPKLVRLNNATYKNWGTSQMYPSTLRMYSCRRFCS